MRIILIPADRRLNRTGDFSCLFISKSYNRKVIGLVSRTAATTAFLYECKRVFKAR